MQPTIIQLSLSQAKADPSIAWARFCNTMSLTPYGRLLLKVGGQQVDKRYAHNSWSYLY